MVVTWTYIQYVLILLKLKRKNEWGKEDKRKEWASWSEFHLKKGQTIKSKASSPTTSTLSHFSEAGLFGEVAMCWEVGQTLLHAREQVWRFALLHWDPVDILCPNWDYLGEIVCRGKQPSLLPTMNLWDHLPAWAFWFLFHCKEKLLHTSLPF